MRPPVFLTLALTLLAAPARGGVELTAMAGYRSGELSYPIAIACIEIFPSPCPVGARSEEGEVFGLVLDVPWSEEWAVEALVNHQETRLRFLHSPLLPPADRLADGELEVTRAYAGVRRQWPRPRLTPFVAAGVGLADFRVTRAPPVLVPEELRGARLSATLAAGFEIALQRRLGLRIEARGYWTGLPERAGGDLVQTDAAIGLSYRP
jgi:hypothetical protein